MKFNAENCRQDIEDLQVSIGFLKDSKTDRDIVEVFESKLQDLQNELEYHTKPHYCRHCGKEVKFYHVTQSFVPDCDCVRNLGVA